MVEPARDIVPAGIALWVTEVHKLLNHNKVTATEEGNSGVFITHLFTELRSQATAESS